MKTYIICILILFTSLLQAQNYQVFRFTGDVKVYKDQLWTQPERRMTISFTDSIDIPNNRSSLSLLNSTNNQIIEIKKMGKHSAKKIIDATVQESANILAYTTQNIAKSVSSNNKKQNYNIYGATMRADLYTMGTNQDIANQIESLISNISKGEIPKSSKLISIEKKSISEGIIGFNIINKSDKPYVVNILRIPEIGYPTFCFNFDKTNSEYFFALISPNSTTSFTQVQFLEDNSTYVLVATEEIFDSTWVEHYLRNRQKNTKNKTSKKIKVYFFTIL